MRINFLLPHLKPSGGVTGDLGHAHELSKRGHQITVAIENRSISRYYRNIFNSHPLLPKDSRVRIRHVKSFDDLPDADIFFADSWKVAKKLYNLDKKGLKFEWVQHDERLYHGDPKKVEEVYRLPLIKMVTATWLKDLFRKEFNYDAEVLFNAIDCILFHPRSEKRPDNDIRILLLCHDFAWKGTKEGVEIVQNLKKKYPNIKLILFGTREGKIEYAYDEYHFNLFREKLAELFRSCDIFLGPSWYEGLNLPPRWAMASSCAVVTYDNGSSRDYAFDGETALVAERKNKNELSRKLEELINNQALREKIARQGLEYVRKMPTGEELAIKLETIFIKALNERNNNAQTGKK